MRNVHTYSSGHSVPLLLVAVPTAVKANLTDFAWDTDEYGPDTTQAVTFAFQRANLIDINLKPDIGDVINWNYAYFEINSINENMLIGGDVNKNFDLVCTTHLTRLSRVNLVERSK